MNKKKETKLNYWDKHRIGEAWCVVCDEASESAIDYDGIIMCEECFWETKFEDLKER